MSRTTPSARNDMGPDKKMKLVRGVVVSTRSDSSGPRTKCFITTDYEFVGANAKRMDLSIRSVKNGEPIDPPSTENAHAGPSLATPAREIVEEDTDYRHVKTLLTVQLLRHPRLQWPAERPRLP